jgi:AcrR family transcriptional regulator
MPDGWVKAVARLCEQSGRTAVADGEGGPQVAAETGGETRHARNPRGTGDRLRQELVDAAAALLSGGATHESLSLRAVAREVGVAATSIYLHFPDKVALLLAVYERQFAQLADYLERAIARHRKPAQRLRAAARAYCRFAVENPDAYEVMFTAAETAGPRRHRPVISPDQRPGTAVILVVQNVLAECIEAGVTQRTDPFQGTLCLWAALHGLITLRAARPSVPWPPLDDLVDTLLTTYVGPA